MGRYKNNSSDPTVWFPLIWGNVQFAALCSTRHCLAPLAIIKIHHSKTFQHTPACWSVVYTSKNLWLSNICIVLTSVGTAILLSWKLCFAWISLYIQVWLFYFPLWRIVTSKMTVSHKAGVKRGHTKILKKIIFLQAFSCTKSKYL